MEMKINKKILVVDDEVEVGEVIVDSLTQVYEHVRYVSNPGDVEAAIAEFEPHLVLSDVNMPKIPGPELIRILRGHGNLVPIIFLTGYADKTLVLSALRLGVADVIEKPFQVDDLLHSIARVIEIEKRRNLLAQDNANREVSTAKVQQQKKMLGLLQVANEKKKTG